ncbi:MAG TPA: reverse transcriptase domain-containing protein [Candidatus Moranbacteria bacterium]|nr:reverse transcriptase domain-containing protein [Candidatus Moranbacteria bacterium]
MSEIFNLKKLYVAYLDCRKTKRNSESAVEFEFGLEKNLQKLLFELKSGKYEPGKSICFVAREPKPREVFAANFRDRIVHHLLIREIHDAGERIFIFDSYACRKGKGTHQAVRKLRKFLRDERAGKKPLYFLQLDIEGFFMSIDKEILGKLAERLIERQNKSENWKKEAKWLAEKIIRHDPTRNFQMNSPKEFFDLIPDRKSLFCQPLGKGLPIGNYTSQFFANLYLNELDQFVKRKLRCRRYVRYVDDFILLHRDPAVLRSWMKEIAIFTRGSLGLRISSRKIRMQRVEKGIDFLGYFIKPDYVLARKAVTARFRNKFFAGISKAKKKKDPGFSSMISSYFGHFSHADCEMLMKKYADFLR